MRYAGLLLSLLLLTNTNSYSAEHSKAQLMAKMLEMLEHNENDNSSDIPDGIDMEGLGDPELIEL